MSVDPIDSELYGPLFADKAYADVFSDRERLAAMLQVEAALAHAQAHCGVIPAKAAKTIAENCRAELYDMAALGQAAALSGNPVIPMTRALGERCGPDAGKFVHWGATTQDIADTALVLQARRILGLLQIDLRNIIKILIKLAKRHRDTVMAGRSFLQHALPTTFGCRVAGWLSPVLRHAERLEQMRPRLLAVQLGGAAGTLASLGDDALAVRAALADELDLGVPDMPWHAARDRFAELAALCGLIAGSCGKIAGDVALLMQTELGEVFEAAGAGKGGSSTMPHKRNPVAATLIRARAGQVRTLVPVMLAGLEADHERATGPWHAEWLALPQILVLSGSALRATAALAEGLEVDGERMRANLDITHGLMLGEAVMMAIAPELGRQQAHDLVERASKTAVAQKRHLKEVLGEEAQVVALLGAERLEELFDPAGYTGQAGKFVDDVVALAETALRDH